MIVVGCVQDESEGEGEDLKPLVYLLTGDFFAQGAPITVKNLKMSDMGIRRYEHDYSPASFKFLYIEARYVLRFLYKNIILENCFSIHIAIVPLSALYRLIQVPL